MSQAFGAKQDAPRRFARWWRGQSESLEKDVQSKLNLILYSQKVTAKRIEVLESSSQYIYDLNEPPEYRVMETIALVAVNAPFLDPGDDENSREALMMWNEIIGREFMPALHTLKWREFQSMQGAPKQYILDTMRMREVLKMNSDEWWIPDGMDLVYASFSKQDHVPQFLASLQNATMGFGQMGQPLIDPRLKEAMEKLATQS